ncbi:GNAT family N-acetyltransferase [Clostridium manihotivorum]|uniref:GNAT family N-acetyltransferase n=1 Tax=Clostridium manihotivorum TaxID=2320868 RepID=A0A410DWK5_9CLOT|nr:GNAT family N-acetyltransferase [Clostridium manihotivorum]QAA33368.1 GNAT family N-acetyltransferase [Clostridium manihotivorum]
MKILLRDPNSKDAIELTEELSVVLKSITGASGKSSFNPSDVMVPRALFAIAYDNDDNPIGCGAIRPITDTIAEVKRMYSRPNSKGVGTAILKYLEAEATSLGYKKLYVETRVINKNAVDFYIRKGYITIPTYGKYINNKDAICFEKFIL